MKEELEKQFVTEKAALDRKIKGNKRARIFSVVVMIILWAFTIVDTIAWMKTGKDTLKFIARQNAVYFQFTWAFLNTLWCYYSIPKSEKVCIDAIDSFIEKWESCCPKMTASSEKPESLDSGVALSTEETEEKNSTN